MIFFVFRVRTKKNQRKENTLKQHLNIWISLTKILIAISPFKNLFALSWSQNFRVQHLISQYFWSLYLLSQTIWSQYLLSQYVLSKRFDRNIFFHKNRLQYFNRYIFSSKNCLHYFNRYIFFRKQFDRNMFFRKNLDRNIFFCKIRLQLFRSQHLLSQKFWS